MTPWTRTLLVLSVLTLSIEAAWGADSVLSRDVSASGADVVTQIDGAVAEMRHQLASQGCDRIVVAYWSKSVPIKRLHVEVWCRDGEEDAPAAMPIGERR